MSSDEIAGACLFKFLSDNTLVENAIITTLKPMAIVFTDHSVKSIDVLKKAKQVEETVVFHRVCPEPVPRTL